MPRACCRSPLPGNGFTLIEMVVTIAIIILAAGFIAPTLTEMFQSRKLENATTLIVGSLNEARNEAVTQKRAHAVVFLQRGVRLYREGKGTESGSFLGGLRSYAPDDEAETVRYHLQFAGKSYEDISRLLIAQEEGADDEDLTLRDGDLYLRLLPDGTVDFGNHKDVPSFQYNAKPPRNADVIIERAGDRYNRGFVDIRPTGRSVHKVEELIDDEE
ncbi:MAG: Tfp pilus assembly protein FimT/FimU [Planctomycetota bacterium]